jgi:hypothetical protein
MVRRVALFIVASIVGAASYASAQVETVANFNPTLLETPENIAIDRDNNKYVSLALTGDGPTAVFFGHKNEGFDLYIANAAFPFFQVPPPRTPSLLRLRLDVHGVHQP